MDASSIADKYITRDGKRPGAGEAKEVVWAPIKISAKEKDWLSKAVLRGGYIPTRDRDGDSAPFLTELRSMHGRGLIQGMPWRITKFGRECLRELEAKPVVPPIPLMPKIPQTAIPKPDGRSITIRPIAEVERELIENAVAQLNGNKSHAARALGISVRTIRNKLHQYRQQPREA